MKKNSLLEHLNSLYEDHYSIHNDLTYMIDLLGYKEVLRKIHHHGLDKTYPIEYNKLKEVYDEQFA